MEGEGEVKVPRKARWCEGGGGAGGYILPARDRLPLCVFEALDCAASLPGVVTMLCVRQ